MKMFFNFFEVYYLFNLLKLYINFQVTPCPCYGCDEIIEDDLVM